MEFRDYYDTLGIERNASPDEIKRAYRRLARKYHPDVSTEPDAETRFKEMKEAYEVLKDPEKRAAYDQFGEHWKSGQQFEPPPQWNQEFTFDQGGFENVDAGDFSDFFESLFGQRGHGPHARGFESTDFRNAPRHGENINAQISIPLEDAFRGTTRQISLDIPEADDSGRVTRKRRTLNVTIPKGIKTGQRIRLENQGGPGFGNGTRKGDLFLKVEIEKHPVFEVDGRNVYLQLPITPAEAALGRTVQAPTLGGAVDLKIPPGSSTGKQLRLKGRGLPGKTPGDQYVALQVVIPKDLSDEERGLYEQLEKVESFNPRANLESVS
jgi:curved DNA-binding protein